MADQGRDDRVEAQAGSSSASMAAAPLPSAPPTLAPLEFDDFGLPIQEYFSAERDATEDTADATKTVEDAQVARDRLSATLGAAHSKDDQSDSDDGDFRDARSSQGDDPRPASAARLGSPTSLGVERSGRALSAEASERGKGQEAPVTTDTSIQLEPGHSRGVSGSGPANGVSQSSHQRASLQPEKNDDEDDDGGWQDMPSYARYDMYDDNDRLIARERNFEEIEEPQDYTGAGGAAKGYTRVIMDDDAQSATSMDDHTQYLFKNPNGTGMGEDEDEDVRDAVSQMQATKDLLTEGQRVAYVGVVRLEIATMVKEAESLETTKKIKREVTFCAESMQMWGQKMMMRLYTHMDINEAEQVMIEQLAEHGVRPEDLTPALLANSRVQNPMAEEKEREREREREKEREKQKEKERRTSSIRSPTVGTPPPYPAEDKAAELPPLYETSSSEEMPEVKTPSQMPTTEKIDIDLRWTALCDLFLVLVADSIYDARSRVLMERVGRSLDVTWLDICKFEKRVTDALEMQQQADKEDWNEDENMELRRKAALKKRYIMMGLATVGGGLVIGLSAGLLAPVIGAGLAAGFTTIGVTGTGTFLAGAGGAAVITSTAAASGSYVGIKAAERRTGAVKTFEYRPLHNNKRVNLIVTVSGWMTGKVDDVRLPFSTVDPLMGDLYSVLWEPEMLKSMGDTINILATEALTQGLQQILGNTILVSLMAAVQLPVVLTKLAYLIDNPWAVSLDRAVAAGQILADSLLERSLGTRPITLVGYSLGARVIFSCLRELAKKGAYGIIQNVYLFGSPIVVKKEEYIMARTVVCGRFVNGYSRNDWILGYLFRLTNGGIRRVAGLAPIEDLGGWMENVDVGDLVPGHMEYRTAMPMLLMRCGWVVESEEFTEIEDPDPDNHGGRQRELINEIEEARKELERESKANRRSTFSIFGRRKKTDKQEWEIYEDSSRKGADGEDKDKDKEKEKEKDKDKGVMGGNNHGVLFDIDAIRAELAKEALARGASPETVQVREIETTMPPMKLDLSSPVSPQTPRRGVSTGPHRDSYRSSMASTRGGTESASASVSTAIAGAGYSPANSQTSFESRSLRGTSTSSALAYEYGGKHGEEEEEEEEEDGVQMTFDTSFGDKEAVTSSDEVMRDRCKSEKTMEQAMANVSIADPWNDGEEEYGKEGEISMTFA